MKKITIAIDGPAGAGKSTIAKILSKRLGILYLDTGAMYRGVALKMLNLGVDPQDTESVKELLKDTHIQVKYEGENQKVVLDGADVTSQIRTPKVSQAASDVAVIPEVRLKLVELQRKISEEESLVMDGRDIGTYVLPHADKKFFLTASVEERAHRRWIEMKEKGIAVQLEDVIEEIKRRDKNDSTRAFAPLKQAEDAILVDTTNKSIQQVVEEICTHLP